ncbi:MAG: PIG-L deacetylase family protein [Anaerolineae bacterium]
MKSELSLLAIFAHPDDEAFGTGGTLAKYAAEGIQVSLLTATRGEAGQISDPNLATPENLSTVREQELRCACQIMGVTNLEVLGYLDGQLASCDPHEVEGKIVRVIRRYRPQVMITFGPDGIYGHPDHVAVHHFAKAAFYSSGVASAFPEHLAEGLRPHAVSKLYYRALPKSNLAILEKSRGSLQIELNGQILRFQGMDEEQITTVIDISAYLETKKAAIQCHRTQLPPEGRFARLSEQEQRQWLSQEHFILAESRLPLGRGGKETDLFAGLR